MKNIPEHDSNFRFIDDGEGVAILLSETDDEKAEIIFRVLQDGGWQWVIEGESTYYPSEWQMPLDGPRTLPTLQQCVEDAIEFIKHYSIKTGDQKWYPTIDHVKSFLMLNVPPTVINTRKQLGPGVCSHGYDMEV
jgi:hypothetical protein